MTSIASSLTHAVPLADRALGLTLTPRAAISLLWLTMTFTTIDLAPRSIGVEFSVDWQTLFRLGLCTACGLYGLRYLPYTLPQFFRFPAAWAVLFVGWAALIVPLSVSPAYSSAAVFATACVTLFVPALLVNAGYQRTVEQILNALLFFVALNWFLYLFVPPLGRSIFEMPDEEIVYRFGNDAQQLGLQCAWAIGILISLTVAGQRRWISTIAIVAGLAFTLVLTESRTAIAATGAIVAVVLWRRLTASQRLAAGTVAVLIAGSLWLVVATDILPLNFEFMAENISRSGEAEEVQSFTGRTDVWEHAWEQFRRSPYFGCGYGASRFVMNDESKFGNFQPDHAHNLLLNAALCTGVVGAILLLAAVGHLLICALRGGGALPAIVVTFVIVAGLTEPVLYGPMPRSHTLIWLVALFWTQLGTLDRSHGVDVQGDSR